MNVLLKTFSFLPKIKSCVSPEETPAYQNKYDIANFVKPKYYLLMYYQV